MCPTQLVFTASSLFGLCIKFSHGTTVIWMDPHWTSPLNRSTAEREGVQNTLKSSNTKCKMWSFCSQFWVIVVCWVSRGSVSFKQQNHCSSAVEKEKAGTGGNYKKKKTWFSACFFRAKRTFNPSSKFPLFVSHAPQGLNVSALHAQIM